MDYSFLKLYDTINESINDNLRKYDGPKYFLGIQLSPNEFYMQMTNYQGGLSFGGNYTCHIVDSCDNILADISNNVFIEEYVDVNGDTQNRIEIIKLGLDYYGRAVHIRFTAEDSLEYYYTRPILISDKELNRTYRFDYKNNSNSTDLSYVNAGVIQSVRLRLDFAEFSNGSEVGEYFQISNGNIISHRFLKKVSRSYLFEKLDTFLFQRVQELLTHDVIYIDGERITDKPILEPGDKIGRSNLMKANFTGFVDERDTFTPVLQNVSLDATELIPLGVYTSATYPDLLKATFQIPIQLNTGELTVHDASDGSILATYTEADMSVSVNELTIPSFTGLISSNGEFYINFTTGLLSFLGIQISGIDNDIDWSWSIQDAVFDGSVFDSSKFLTN